MTKNIYALLQMMKLEEKKETNEGGGAPKPEPKAEAPAAGASGDKAPQGEGNPGDSKKSPLDFYDKKPEGEKDEKGNPPKESKQPEAAPKDEKVDPALGYDKKIDPPKDEEAPPPAKKEEPPQDELKLEGLSEDEAKQVREDIKDLGLDKEKAQKYADKQIAKVKAIESARAEIEKEADKQKLKTRSQWQEELKTDSTFGGDKFDKNLERAEKLLQQYGPELKKQLTEAKGMLPPNAMRLLMRVAGAVYGTEKLVQGEPSAPAEEKKPKERDPLEFYRQNEKKN